MIAFEPVAPTKTKGHVALFASSHYWRVASKFSMLLVSYAPITDPCSLAFHLNLKILEMVCHFCLSHLADAAWLKLRA